MYAISNSGMPNAIAHKQLQIKATQGWAHSTGALTESDLAAVQTRMPTE
jgi:hypothetical protein